MNVKVMKLNPKREKGESAAIAEFEKKDVWYVELLVNGLTINVQEYTPGEISINTGNDPATIQFVSSNQFTIVKK